MALRLRRLKILRFRDVRPGTELHFHEGWNVLLGHNATGKTTLLNLISMALRGDFRELSGEGFSLEYELGDEASSVLVSLKNDVNLAPSGSGPGVPSPLLEPPTMRDHRATYTVDITSGSERLQIGTPPLAMTPSVQTLSVATGNDLWLTFALVQATLSAPAAASTRWLVYMHPRVFRFDEAAEMFRVVLGEGGDASGLPTNRQGWAFLMGPQMTLGLPLEPSAAAWSLETSDGGPTAILGSFSECKLLGRAVQLLGGVSLHAIYPVTSSTPSQGNTAATLGAPTVTLRRQDGSSMSVRQLSFGQKRLFTFAWYLESNRGPVVADELVNGMHYEWIDECVRAMEGRQKFITAQNPLLLDHVDLESPEDVTRSFVLCRAESGSDGRREIVWTHPSEAQAAEFFRAYQNGVLRVHEILRTEGLW